MTTDEAKAAMQEQGVGNVMAAIGAVLIDRGHDADAVVEGLIEDAGRIEGELWDRMFGPAADAVALRLGLEPCPAEEVQR